MNSIGIIGGGISGLTAAYRLKQLGASVTLYETSSRVGGSVQSVKLEGYLAEFGPNTLLETSPLITGLVNDLGLESHKIYADEKSKNRFIVRRGNPTALPLSPPAFLSSSLFSLSAKLRILREPFITKFPPDKEESVADFVRRRLGNEFLDYAIDPFVSGVYAGDAEKLSVIQAFPKLYALEQKYGSLIKGQIKGKRERSKRGEVAKDRAKMFSFDEGLQVLIDKLSHKLESEIKSNSPVNRIENTPGGWNIYYNDKGTEYIKTHAKIILTAPAYRLAELKHNVEGIDLSPLIEISYPSVTSLALGFKRSDVIHPLDGFGMLIPRKENFHILGTLFSSTLFPGRAPKDHVLLTTYIGGARQPELGSADENTQIDLVMKDLNTLLGIHGDPSFIHRAFFPRAIPQYNLGYRKYMDIMDSFEKNAPGLHLAGNFRNGISLGDCITSSIKLADQLIDGK